MRIMKKRRTHRRYQLSVANPSGCILAPAMRYWLFLVAALGCTENSARPGTADLSVEGVNDAAVPEDSDLLPPPLSPWGIDTRPSNSSCVAPARPVSATVMQLGVQPLFPKLLI